MGKWNSSNLSETQGFEYLGHSNWTICSLLSQSVHHIYSDSKLRWEMSRICAAGGRKPCKSFSGMDCTSLIRDVLIRGRMIVVISLLSQNIVRERIPSSPPSLSIRESASFHGHGRLQARFTTLAPLWATRTRGRGALCESTASETTSATRQATIAIDR